MRHGTRNSSVPSCRSSRSSGLCPKTLLVSSRLGGGAPATALVMPHQAGERERQSNRGLVLRAFCPATPAQYTLYRKKEGGKGSVWNGQVKAKGRDRNEEVTGQLSGEGDTVV